MNNEKQLQLEKEIKNCLIEFTESSQYDLKGRKPNPRTMMPISIDLIAKEIAIHLIKRNMV